MSIKTKILAGGLVASLILVVIGFGYYSQLSQGLIKLGASYLDQAYLASRVELAEDYGVDARTALRASADFDQYYQISRELGLEITEQDLRDTGYYLEQEYRENILFRANTFKRALDIKVEGRSRGQYQGALFTFPIVSYDNQEGVIRSATAASKQYALDQANQYREAIASGKDPEVLIEQIKSDPRLDLPMADNSSRLVGYKENESWQNILGAYHEDVIAELERGVDPGLGEVKLAYSYREDPADQEEFMYYFIDIAEHEPKDSEIDQLYQSKLADKSLLLSLLNKLDHSDLEIVPEVYADESSNHQATESIRNQMIAANPRARLFGDVQGQVLGSDNKGVFGAIVKVTFEIQVSNCLECDWAFVRAKDILTPAEVAAVKQGTLQSIGSSANEFAPRYKETSIELVTDEEGWWSLSSIGLLVDCNTSGGHPPTKIKYKVYDIFDGDISDLPSSIGEADLNYVGVNSVTSIVGGSAPTQSIGTSQAGIVNVGGINVAQSIAGNLAKMLDAAKADGVNLSGGGYRSNATQVQLRISHCGSSNYAIYQMPSSQCSPPTARPGKSNHEKGLAIDFNNCSSRSTACYRWLNANANQYGFYNLPSESWHWSVNGK